MKSLHVLLSPLLVLLVVLSNSCASDRGAYVRVNQVGYESGFPMRAYVMTASTQPGASFVVRNSHGDTSYSAAVGSKLGSWGDYTVYALDFSLSAADTYTITVTGPMAATSPTFRVDRADQLYSVALANALSFYQNQRDGE